MGQFFSFRFRVYVAAVAYVVAVFALTYVRGDAGDLRTIRVVEGFGLGALAALYTALVVGPLYKAFPGLPGSGTILKLRGGFGHVAFVLGFAHASVAFWGLLGGLSGWPFLGATYKTATLLSLIALLLLAILFVFSLGGYMQKVLVRFSWLSKVAYLAGLLVLVHVALIGSHFRNVHSFIFMLSFLLLFLLAVLLARQVDWFLAKRFSRSGFFGATLLVVLVAGLFGGRWYFAPTPLATGSMAGMDMSMPGMNMSMASGGGYTLSVQMPQSVVAGTGTPLVFRVFAAGTGALVTDFNLVHDKLAHLVIVNDKLNYYSHIHPDLKDGVFTITTTFPVDDNYRAYLSVEPKGGSEQVFAYAFTAGKGGAGKPDKTLDGAAAKIVSGITVGLSSGKLSATDIAAGKAKLVFHFADSNGKSITDLYPYLAAFGHLVMINTDSYSYLHVHPLVVPFGPDETGGPEVEFMIMGNVEPGVYKLFGQFNPHKELITVPFTIEVTE
jgi:DMSO/TMAO reductase YedYZ heme-binding membrane subunit